MDVAPSKKRRTDGDLLADAVENSAAANADGVSIEGLGCLSVMETVWLSIYSFLRVADVVRVGRTCRSLRKQTTKDDSNKLVAHSLVVSDYGNKTANTFLELIRSVDISSLERINLDMMANWCSSEQIIILTFVVCQLLNSDSMQTVDFNFYCMPWHDPQGLALCFDMLKEALHRQKKLNSFSMHLRRGRARIVSFMNSITPLILGNRLHTLSLTGGAEGSAVLATAIVSASRLESLMLHMSNNWFEMRLLPAIDQAITNGQPRPALANLSLWAQKPNHAFSAPAVEIEFWNKALAFFGSNPALECVQLKDVSQSKLASPGCSKALRDFLSEKLRLRIVNIWCIHDTEEKIGKALASTAFSTSPHLKSVYYSEQGGVTTDYLSGLELYFTIGIDEGDDIFPHWEIKVNSPEGGCIKQHITPLQRRWFYDEW